MVPAKRLVSLLPVLAIVLAGCSGGAPMAPTNSDFFIAFPRIVIEFDQDGSPTVAGIPASMLAGLVDTSTMKLDAGTIATLQSGDIQHIEVLHKDDGLFIFVNSKLLPHLGWSAQSFDTLGKTIESLGMLDASMAKIVKMALPIVTNLGVSVVVKFPIKSGGAAVAVRDINTPVDMPANSPVTPGLIVRLTVRFDEQGAASIANISTRDLAAVFGDTGFDFTQLELPPETIQGLQAANFQHIMLQVGSDGITIFVNSEPLPNIAWSDPQLQNTAELANAFLADDMYKDVRTVVSTMLPQLRMVDAEIIITFPVAANQQAIPLPGSK